MGVSVQVETDGSGPPGHQYNSLRVLAEGLTVQLARLRSEQTIASILVFLSDLPRAAACYVCQDLTTILRGEYTFIPSLDKGESDHPAHKCLVLSES